MSEVATYRVKLTPVQRSSEVMFRSDCRWIFVLCPKRLSQKVNKIKSALFICVNSYLLTDYCSDIYIIWFLLWNYQQIKKLLVQCQTLPEWRKKLGYFNGKYGASCWMDFLIKLNIPIKSHSRKIKKPAGHIWKMLL